MEREGAIVTSFFGGTDVCLGVPGGGGWSEGEGEGEAVACLPLTRTPHLLAEKGTRSRPQSRLSTTSSGSREGDHSVMGKASACRRDSFGKIWRLE